MSNRKRDKDNPLSAQERLFDSGAPDGALDVRLPFRASISRALGRLSKSAISRWHIAAETSRLNGRELSKDILDKCTSSNLDYGLRAEDLPGLFYVLQDLEPLRVLLSSIGCEVIDEKESEFVRLARLERENAELQGEITRLRSKLGIRR